jgi:hypothetical protein
MPFQILSALVAEEDFLQGSGGSSPPPTPGGFGIQISGSRFYDLNGHQVALQGVNLSFGEQGPTSTGFYGQATLLNWPPWSVIKSYGCNVIRFPMNSASWLGLTTSTLIPTGGGGTVGDPLGNYQSTFISYVNTLTSMGIYVILDLHWDAPGPYIDGSAGQPVMAGQDHGIPFWTSIANTFGYGNPSATNPNPGVIFELFNEPQANPNGVAIGLTYSILRNGGSLPTVAYWGGSHNGSFSYTWNVAGYQQMLNAIRATGAQNICLISDLGGGGDTANWYANRPSDTTAPAGFVGTWKEQIAAVIHDYYIPAQSYYQTNAITIQTSNPGYPVIFTEFGRYTDSNGVAQLSASSVYAAADGVLNSTGSTVGTVAWLFDNWGNTIVTDAAGDPTSDYGTPLKARYLLRGAFDKISVNGSHFVDGLGNNIQLRGVNVAGLEGGAVAGLCAYGGNWGEGGFGGPPNYSYIKAMGANCVRFPVNESTWLGLTGLNVENGATVNAAQCSGGAAQYQLDIRNAVIACQTLGMIPIIDLHCTAPGAYIARNRAMLPDDHTLNFWISVANYFKDNPGVMFELFNEPLSGNPGNGWAVTNADRIALRDGAAQTIFMDEAGYSATYSWTSVGFNSLISGIRGTGATNVILASCQYFAHDIQNWLAYAPTDPLNQLACVWHTYDNTSNYTTAYNPYLNAVLAAGYPVIITEYGDNIGGPSYPCSAAVWAWADAASAEGASYLAWTFNPWAAPNSTVNPAATADVLINGTAPVGTNYTNWGAAVKAHYLSRPQTY